MSCLRLRMGPWFHRLCVLAILATPAQSLVAETPPAGNWRVDFNGSSSNVVLVDGVLYVGAADGAVYALDANTGQTKWRFQTGEKLSSGTPVITVPKGSSLGDQMRAAMDAVDAQRALGKKTIDMTPIVADRTVYVGSGDLSFYALDAATGQKKWSYPAGPGLSDPSVLREGTLYFTTEEGLHAVDASTGQRKWLFQTLQEIPVSQTNLGTKRAPLGPLVSAEGTLLVTAWPTIRAGTPQKSFLYAVDAQSGAAKWTASFDGLDILSPATTGSLVFVTVNDPDLPPASSSDQTVVYAVNMAGGKIAWSAKSKTRFGSHRLLLRNNALFFVTPYALLALDPQSGRQLWSFQGDELDLNVLADDRQLYVATHKGSKGTLHALTLTTGQEAWTSGGDSVTALENGVVYVEVDPHSAFGLRQMRALDAANGKQLWVFRGEGRERVSLASSGHLFLISATIDYIGTKRVDQGRLYSIDAKTGAWKP